MEARMAKIRETRPNEWRGSTNYSGAAKVGMRRLLETFPNANIPPDSNLSFLRDFEETARQFGCERFLLAIEHARKWEINDLGNERPRKFFPNPNEVRGAVPPKGFEKNFAEWGCEHCNFTSWIQNEHGASIRCECFEVYKQQRESGAQKPAGLVYHSPEEWAAIRGEQATPEFRKSWEKFSTLCGFKAEPWELGKIMDGKR